MAFGEEFTYVRAQSARVIDRFSIRGHKTVELAEDNDGVFVRRVYEPRGVRYVERCNRSFSEAWGAYNEMLQSAGVTIVPSTLLEDEGNRKPIIVAEYIENAEIKQVSELPLPVRRDAATSLGKLLSSHRWFLPSAEAFHQDAFVAHNGDAVLIDVDPYLVPRNRSLSPDMEAAALRGAQGAFMLSGAKIIDTWCKSEDDLRSIASAYTREIGHVVADSPSLALSNEFSIPYFMSNGMTYEEASTLV